jgi:phytoene dehydrogenase-like protein
MDHFDAIVIGAGASGLTAACMLAHAGRRVVVLERGARAGGALFTEKRDGFLFSSELHAGRFLNPAVLAALELSRHGLQLLPVPAAYGLTGSGEALCLTADPDAVARMLSEAAPRDAERLFELKALVQRQAALMASWPAPAPEKRRLFAPRRAGLLAAQEAIAALGDPLSQELLQFWSASLGDILNEYLSHEPLKAMLALRALAGAPCGPFAPGTAARLLDHPFFAPRAESEGLGTIPAGGGSALAEALAAALKEKGGSLRLGAAVTAVLLENGHAAGVVLENGEEIRSDAVLSSLDVKRTFMTLFDWESLPKPFMGRVAKAPAQGATAKLDLALDELPEFPALPEDWTEIPGDIVLADDLNAIDAAYRRWLAGLPPESPPLILSLPALIDRHRAPPRHHVLSITVQFVPGLLFDGPWTAERRQSFVASIFDQLKRVSPGLMDRVRDMRLLLPPDIEAETGITGGGLAQAGAPAPLPLSVLAGEGPRFGTPVPGLYLCDGLGGAGGLSGESGAGAAAAVLGLMKARPR